MQWTDLPCETANRLQVWMFGFAKTMVNLNDRTDVTFACHAMTCAVFLTHTNFNRVLNFLLLDLIRLPKKIKFIFLWRNMYHRRGMLI